jgi:hypothetical protein
MVVGIRTWAVIVIVFFAAGCAQLGRLPAVPAEATSRATVLGIANARFFPTEIAALAALGRRINERERTYWASLGRPVPPETILALSGGGDRGAFGAGLLVGWSEKGTRPRFKVVTGISTGAITAPFAFLGSEYDPALAEIYTTIQQEQVFQRRPMLAGLVSDAFADSSPLQTMIAHYLDERIVARIAEEYRRGRVLVIVTTNLDAGVPVMWNIGAIAASGYPEAVGLIRKILLASASIPAVFPSVMFDVAVHGVKHQELHVDGGASMQTFLYPANLLLAKLDLPGARRTRTAYVIRNGHLGESWHETERSTMSIATRAVATLTTNSGVGDLYRMYSQTKRDGAALRLAFIDDDFTERSQSEFDRAYMIKLFDYARAKARAGYPWRNAPPGF